MLANIYWGIGKNRSVIKKMPISEARELATEMSFFQNVNVIFDGKIESYSQGKRKPIF